MFLQAKKVRGGHKSVPLRNSGNFFPSQCFLESHIFATGEDLVPKPADEVEEDEERREGREEGRRGGGGGQTGDGGGHGGGGGGGGQHPGGQPSTGHGRPQQLELSQLGEPIVFIAAAL